MSDHLRFNADEPLKKNGAAIVRKREALKMNQTELAELMQLPVQTLRNYEYDRRPIPSWFWRMLQMIVRLRGLNNG